MLGLFLYLPWIVTNPGLRTRNDNLELVLEVLDKAIRSQKLYPGK